MLDILFPDKCLYCKKYGKIICNECFKKLNNKSIFKRLNGNYFDYIFCTSFYNELIKSQIHKFKFYNQAYFYRYFIEISLRDCKIFDFLKKFDFITYIPMNYKKQIKRGYNQSELLAKELGKKLKIKVINTLKKIDGVKTQSTLTKEERKENVKNAFEFIGDRDLKGKNIILVDDILTTGSTAEASSKILKENNVNIICVFAIAKTQIKKIC